MYFILKTLITALIVVGISELAKRYSILSAALASLPLTSILAFIWIYYENRNTQQIIELSYNIFWLVIPSLLFFLIMPFLLKAGIKFVPSLLIACAIMSLGYGGFIYLKKIFFDV
jgi:hypothetical protein